MRERIAQAADTIAVWVFYLLVYAAAFGALVAVAYALARNAA